MTKEEFDNTRWTCCMEVTINGEREELVGVDLRSRQVFVALSDGIGCKWLPCEWVELVSKEGGAHNE